MKNVKFPLYLSIPEDLRDDLNIRAVAARFAGKPRWRLDIQYVSNTRVAGEVGNHKRGDSRIYTGPYWSAHLGGRRTFKVSGDLRALKRHSPALYKVLRDEGCLMIKRGRKWSEQ